MALSINYFYSLTPRQFFNIQKGWLDKRDAESKERMIYVRRLMYAVLAPHSKNLTEQSIWPFDWENQSNKERTQEEQDKMEKELEASIERWRIRDEKKQAKSVTDS